MLTKNDFISLYDNVFNSSPEILRESSVPNMMYALNEYLEQESAKYNLTAIKDPAEAMVKHYFDCLTAAYHISELLSENEASKYIDIGSGAGFPALPAAALFSLIRPRCECRAVDATSKKCAFMNTAASLMGLSPQASGEFVSPSSGIFDSEDSGQMKSSFLAVQGRAEELGKNPEWREKFDVSSARAVAGLGVLLELCLPFVKIGGCFAAMKAAGSDDEISLSGSAAEKLGASLENEISYQLPGGAGERRLLIYRKTAPTPEKYPRKFKQISTSPLK